MYQVGGTTQVWGSTITQQLVPVSGYARRFRVRWGATGGAGTVVTAVNADAPFNLVQQVILNDSQGNTILNLPGWEALKLIPLLSASYGLWRYGAPDSSPNYSAPVVGANASGNFHFESWIPLEFAEAVGVLGMDNASVLPTLTWTVAGSATVYSTAPNTTLPALTLEVDADYYWNPDNAGILPPGLGSSRQWKLLAGTPQAAPGSALPITCPKFGGGFLDSITIVSRRTDTNARTDANWPSRLQLMIDGTQICNETIDQVIADMYNAYQFPSNADPYYNGGTETIGARPVGVLTIPLKNNISQVITGLDDSGRSYIPTTPGTNLQMSGTGWQGGQAGQFNFIPGLVVPAGTLVTGQPEV
jgi:hypothetical protein